MLKLSQQQINNALPKFDHLGKRMTLIEIQDENKGLREIINDLKTAIYDLKIKDVSNAKLLTIDEIHEKLGRTTLSENGYFYSRAKNNNPQSSMLSLSNLLVCLENSTLITGEYSFYEKMFLKCENSLDLAMRSYLDSNFVAEMHLCREVQQSLTLLVQRGYGTFNADSYEAMLLTESDNSESQTGDVQNRAK
jgi:hypothetical protein